MKRLLISLCVGCFGVSNVLILASIGQGTMSDTYAAPLLTNWYVDAATGDDNNDCLSLATACLTVTKAISKAESGDTIQVAAGIYQESIQITHPLTVTGAGPDATFLDGGDTQRVLSTSSGPILIKNLTVQNGRNGDPNSGSIFDNSAGGIFNQGILILENVYVIENTAISGGGIFNGGNLTLIDGKVSDNASTGGGGGLYTWYGSTTNITTSMIYSNTGNQGGGLYNLGELSIRDSTVASNMATNASGGGLLIFSGTVTLNRVTLSNNQAVSFGGGVSNQLGRLNLINSTISGNTGNPHGGLDNRRNAETTVLNSTITNNTSTNAGTPISGVGNSGTISFQNSVVAHNNGRNCNASGNWISLGHNLSDGPHCDFTHSNDLPNTPANLAPLSSYNNSFTEMHGLLSNSSAIDGGSNINCPPSDQRSVVRPVDGDNDGTATCDIGAFEVRQQLSIGDVMITEGTGITTTAVFSVNLSPTSNQTVTVDYETADNTALSGTDFVAQSDTLTFAPEQSEQSIAIDIFGDIDDEPDETFFLTLNNANNADIVDGQAVATLVDDDGAPSLTVSDISVNESNSGQTVAQVAVVLSPASVDAVMVGYETIDGSAEAASDYEATSGTLAFAPGQESKTVEIFITGDLLDEGLSESFSLHLSNATNATIAANEAIITILDNDTARVSVQPGPSIFEGDSGTRTAIFTITVQPRAAFPISVDYVTISGTVNHSATPNVDYEPQAGSLMFVPEESIKFVDVPIIGDTKVEPDEHFSLELANASPVSISGNVASATILNDDDPNKDKSDILIYLPFVVHDRVHR